MTLHEFDRAFGPLELEPKIAWKLKNLMEIEQQRDPEADMESVLDVVLDLGIDGYHAMMKDDEKEKDSGNQDDEIDFDKIMEEYGEPQAGNAG